MKTDLSAATGMNKKRRLDLDWWVPTEPGDRVAGLVLKRGEVRTRLGPREYLLLQEANGSQVKVIMTGALVERWRDVAPGWRVEATYLGRIARFSRFRCSAQPPEGSKTAPQGAEEVSQV